MMVSKINYLFSIILLLFVVSSCNSAFGPDGVDCPIDSCSNEGVLNECGCDCPENYTGETCQRIDLTQPIQNLIDAGISPFDILNAGAIVDSIYGKTIQGGLVFHLNIVAKSVKITAPKDTETNLDWPNAVAYCNALDIDGVDDWYLPSLDELKDVRNRLYSKLEVGDFQDRYYWSADTNESNTDEAFALYFLNGNFGPLEKTKKRDISFNHVRAIRRIEL
jgi:hypothetical protein